MTEIAKTTQKQTTETISSPKKGIEAAMINIVWRGIIQYLKDNNDSMTLTSLNTVSSIIYKMVSACIQMETIKIKLKELALKEKQDEPRSSGFTPYPSPLIQPEVMKQIERDLKLL